MAQGRPSRIEESTRAAVINQSWEILHKLLFNTKSDKKDLTGDKVKGSNLPYAKKVFIATEIAKKSMPTKIDADVRMKIDDVLDDLNK